MKPRAAEPKFEKQCRLIPISEIVPYRAAKAVKYSAKYAQILASIKEVGLVEAPVVHPMPDGSGRYGLLDGHLRIQALVELGVTEVSCLIAIEDDTYTYNRHINRLSPVQDHRMIAAAIKQGVPSARLASALNLSPDNLRKRRALLNGVCPEARAMLASKECPRQIFDMLKRLKPLRQIEACELMEGQNNYTSTFARAIVAATAPEQLINPKRQSFTLGSIEHMASLEKELAKLQEQTRAVEASYGPDVLRFTVIKEYIAALLVKPSIAGLMQQRYPDIFRQFEKMVAMSVLPESVSAG